MHKNDYTINAFLATVNKCVITPIFFVAKSPRSDEQIENSAYDGISIGNQNHILHKAEQRTNTLIKTLNHSK